MTDSVIRVDALAKTFRQGFWRKRVDALRDVSFEVPRGCIFGFLGPNGAGKTTTIKILTGLIAPSGGAASVHGHAVPSPEAMKRVGFLPENPYVYPYLSPLEFVTMCARLSGVPAANLRKRCGEVIDRVGISYAADRPVQRLSKGMLQRACLAAALVSDPELLILDEPMSGLDPVGRKEVRDIILEERSRGRTVFFSSHILSDVESMCDQVTILRKGSVVVQGKIHELLRSDVMVTDVVLIGESASCTAVAAKLGALEGVKCEAVVDTLRVHVTGDKAVTDVLRVALADGLRVVEVTPRRDTLEDLFVAKAFGDA